MSDNDGLSFSCPEEALFYKVGELSQKVNEWGAVVQNPLDKFTKEDYIEFEKQVDRCLEDLRTWREEVRSLVLKQFQGNDAKILVIQVVVTSPNAMSSFFYKTTTPALSQLRKWLREVTSACCAVAEEYYIGEWDTSLMLIPLNNMDMSGPLSESLEDLLEDISSDIDTILPDGPSLLEISNYS